MDNDDLLKKILTVKRLLSGVLDGQEVTHAAFGGRHRLPDRHLFRSGPPVDQHRLWLGQRVMAECTAAELATRLIAWDIPTLFAQASHKEIVLDSLLSPPRPIEQSNDRFNARGEKSRREAGTGPLERDEERMRRRRREDLNDLDLEHWAQEVLLDVFDAACRRMPYTCPVPGCNGRLRVDPVDDSTVVISCPACKRKREHHPAFFEIPWQEVEKAMRGERVRCPRCDRLLPRGLRTGAGHGLLRCRFCLAVGRDRAARHR